MKCPNCKGKMIEAGSLSNWWCENCGTRMIPNGKTFTPKIVGKYHELNRVYKEFNCPHCGPHCDLAPAKEKS